MNPVLINSKRAQDHLAKIKTQHADLLNGIANQSLKVQAYNQQQQEAKRQRDLLDIQNKKENQARQDEIDRQFQADQKAAQKEAADRDMKIKEIELKRMALTQTPQ